MRARVVAPALSLTVALAWASGSSPEPATTPRAQSDAGEVPAFESVDAGAPPGLGASGTDGGRPPVAEFAPPSRVTGIGEGSARVRGSVILQGGVDTSFDSPRGHPLAENVFDLRSRAVLGVDARLSDSMQAVAEGQVFWRSVAQRRFDRTKATAELELGEAFVDLYAPAVDLRLGRQYLPLGANAAFAPSDRLSPRDLRQSWLLGEVDDGRIPVLAARAIGTVGGVSWTAAYVPFFVPNRYAVFGQDEALVQPALELALPIRIHESIEDELQPHLLETERPRAFPWLGDAALRAVVPLGQVRAGLSWIWINEKMPGVEIDPELAVLARAAAQQVDPPPLIVQSVQSRLAAGERLSTGRYARAHVFSAEARALLGPAQLDVDVGYSPAQTVVLGGDLRPSSKRTLTWAVGVSQAEDSPFLYAATYVGIAVPDLPSEQFLFLLEPETAARAPRTVFFHALVAKVGYELWDERLEVSARGAFEPVQRSWALGPRIAWKGMARLTLALGAELYGGPERSPFGYFRGNDQLVGQLAVDFF
jgi:hypothetical protein